MILDNQALFSDAQAITTTAITASTNVLDLGAMAETAYGKVAMQRNLGKGMGIPLLLQVIDDFATAAGATHLRVVVQYSTDEVFTTPINAMDFQMPIADLVGGYISPVVNLPREIKGRYLRLGFYAIGGAFSAGSVTAGIVAAVDGSYQG